MQTPRSQQGKKKINWAPYLLIAPSVVYLALFFAWPMISGLALAVREEDAVLHLRQEAQPASPAFGDLPRGAMVDILDRKTSPLPEGEAVSPGLTLAVWFQVRYPDADGATIQGWVPESRIRVLAEDGEGNPVSGSVRPVLSSSADPLTSVFAQPDEGSPPVGQLEARAPVDIVDRVTFEVWFLVRGTAGERSVEGWAESRFVTVLSNPAQGRINRGNAAQWTLQFVRRMVSDRFFWPAFTTTLGLIVVIIPFQFVLAIIMALVIQAIPKGSGFFLYVFSISLGVSDLAVGIVWYSIFTQFGFLNSILQGLGLIDAPQTYLSVNTRYWILIAICLAEIWRATSIVMVIVVAGLQAISREVLEAAEVFGATLWQRVRFVILPLLRPSLQVALILRTILAFQVFAVVIVLGGGDIVTVLSNETYRQYYELRNTNVAAAYASFILLLSMISSFFYLRAVRTQEETTG